MSFEAYVEILRRGGVVACPTETLVGLLADATNPDAVERVLCVKRRPTERAIAVLVPDAAGAATVAEPMSESARRLAESHWPGPLTLLLRARPELPAPLVHEGKVGVRVPGPSLALDLVRAFGGPLTATSANRSGEPAARTIHEARAALGDDVDAYIPGEAPGGLPSTLVDTTVTPFRVLRQGAITLED